MFRPILTSIAFLVSLCVAASAFAQEATAHLVFKKKKTVIPQKKEVKEYTVQANETLIIIVSRQLGVKKERMRFIYREVLPLNPGLKNVNLIYPGQKLILPIVQDELMLAKESVPSQNLDLIRNVLEKLGGGLSTTGQHVIPLGETGQISISCTHVPIADFPDGTVVMLDLKGRLKQDMKNLILKNWPHYRIISVDSKWNTIETLMHLINATAPRQTMAPIKPHLPLRNGAFLFLPSSWLITGTKRLLIYCADPRDERLPPIIRGLISGQGIEIIEIQGEKAILLEPDAAELPSAPVPKTAAETTESFVPEVLSILGYEPKPLKEISVFTLEEHGYTLNIPAICGLEIKGEMIVFTHRTIPLEFQQVIKKKGLKAITLPSGDRGHIIREIAKSLNLPHASGFQTFTISPPGYKKSFAVSFPSLSISRTPVGSVHFIALDLDERLHAAIKQKLGLRLIRY